MKIYWMIESIPELAVFPKRIRLFVWWEFLQNKAFRKWQFWVLLLCFCSIVGLYLAGIFTIRDAIYNILENALYGLVLLYFTHLIIYLGIIFTLQATIIAAFRPLLREFLKAKKPDQPFSEYLFSGKDSKPE